MAFVQLTWRESLRDLEACLSAHPNKLYGMGFRQPVRRSTLADALERRDWPADFAKSFDQLSKRSWSPAFVALEKKWGWSPGGSRSTPGQVGARASGLWKLLEKGHHDVQLTADERRRIALWLDTGSNFYGTYHELETQARGEPVRPELE